MVVLKSATHLSHDDKQLIKEVFRVNAGEQEELNVGLSHIKEVNSRLYFELHEQYDH